MVQVGASTVAEKYICDWILLKKGASKSVLLYIYINF